MQSNSNFMIKYYFFYTPTHHPPAIPNLLLAPQSVELVALVLLLSNVSLELCWQHTVLKGQSGLAGLYDSYMSTIH